MTNEQLFEQARAYGMVDIPRVAPGCFRVFINYYDAIQMWTSGQPIDAYWSGGALVVEMDNGEIRRYHTLSDTGYQIIKYP